MMGRTSVLIYCDRPFPRKRKSSVRTWACIGDLRHTWCQVAAPDNRSPCLCTLQVRPPNNIPNPDCIKQDKNFRQQQKRRQLCSMATWKDIVNYDMIINHPFGLILHEKHRLVLIYIINIIIAIFFFTRYALNTYSMNSVIARLLQLDHFINGLTAINWLCIRYRKCSDFDAWQPLLRLSWLIPKL